MKVELRDKLICIDGLSIGPVNPEYEDLIDAYKTLMTAGVGCNYKILIVVAGPETVVKQVAKYIKPMTIKENPFVKGDYEDSHVVIMKYNKVTEYLHEICRMVYCTEDIDTNMRQMFVSIDAQRYKFENLHGKGYFSNTYGDHIFKNSLDGIYQYNGAIVVKINQTNEEITKDPGSSNKYRWWPF